MARRQSTARSIPRTVSALAELHVLAGHVGPVDGCQDCVGAQRRQRSTSAALRTHQRQARQQVDAILRKAATS